MFKISLKAQIPKIKYNQQLIAEWGSASSAKICSVIVEKNLIKEPDDWFEEDQQSLDEHGGMDDVQSLDVLLIPENTYSRYSLKNELRR